MDGLGEVWQHLPVSRLIFGLDANTHEKRVDGKAHVLDFEESYRSLGLKACWGDVSPKLYTTFNARTYLQPQLNKASKSTELEEKGDRNPKEPGGNANRRSSSSPETPRERGDFTCFHAQKGRFSPGSSPGSTQDDLLLTLGLLSHILRFGR
ncbi:unnamed protein product [Durusdinium trenchii]|uniref:Uncharacterized protein n=2 Tax=Durusdinium trenchii TaxID=1381693 RepID=A0ABP0P690_9DINO